MKCSRCQQDNPSHANFCLGCGVSFKGADPGARPLLGDDPTVRRPNSRPNSPRGRLLGLEPHRGTARLLSGSAR